MRNGPYIMIVSPENYPGKRYRGKYCYEHHAVWWQNTGTTVPEGYTIHHKNGDKHDNRFDNLELLSRSVHTRDHVEGKHPHPRQMIVCRCGKCGIEFFLTPRNHRTRTKQTKSGQLFCSADCAGSGSDRR